MGGWGCVVDLVLFDFVKAFDKVNHVVLVDKLIHLCVGGSLLGWIADFLRDRTLRVVVSGCASSSTTFVSGVPQGSVLVFFSVHVVNNWNALPDHLVGASTLDSFKVLLHRHLGVLLFEF